MPTSKAVQSDAMAKGLAVCPGGPSLSTIGDGLNLCTSGPSPWVLGKTLSHDYSGSQRGYIGQGAPLAPGLDLAGWPLLFSQRVHPVIAATPPQHYRTSLHC